MAEATTTAAGGTATTASASPSADHRYRAIDVSSYTLERLNTAWKSQEIRLPRAKKAVHDILAVLRTTTITDEHVSALRYQDKTLEHIITNCDMIHERQKELLADAYKPDLNNADYLKADADCDDKHTELLDEAGSVRDAIAEALNRSTLRSPVISKSPTRVAQATVTTATTVTATTTTPATTVATTVTGTRPKTTQTHQAPLIATTTQGTNPPATTDYSQFHSHFIPTTSFPLSPQTTGGGFQPTLPHLGNRYGIAHSSLAAQHGNSPDLGEYGLFSSGPPDNQQGDLLAQLGIGPGNADHGGMGYTGQKRGHETRQPITTVHKSVLGTTESISSLLHTCAFPDAKTPATANSYVLGYYGRLDQLLGSISSIGGDEPRFISSAKDGLSQSVTERRTPRVAQIVENHE